MALEPNKENFLFGMKEDLILVSYLFNPTLTHYVMFVLRALTLSLSLYSYLLII